MLDYDHSRFAASAVDAGAAIVLARYPLQWHKGHLGCGEGGPSGDLQDIRGDFYQWHAFCVGLRLANTQVLEREHLKFAFRNLIPISTCFILGYAVPSTCIFIQYDATMANTLAPFS